MEDAEIEMQQPRRMYTPKKGTKYSVNDSLEKLVHYYIMHPWEYNDNTFTNFVNFDSNTHTIMFKFQ